MVKQQFSQSAPVKASASAAATSKQATEYKGKATAEEERVIMRFFCLLLCLAGCCLGQDQVDSPCSSQDTSCILTVLAMRGLIREEQAARQARAEWEGAGEGGIRSRGRELEGAGEGGISSRGRGRGGAARYRPDCWEQEDWPASRGKRGTYNALPEEEQGGVITETEEDSNPDREGNYRTTEGRNGYRGSFQQQNTAGQGERIREGRARGRGRAPCLWEASYYTGDTHQTI